MLNIDKNTQLVNARELHEAIKVKTRFATWVQRCIENLELVEGAQFFPFLGKTISSQGGGRPSQEYWLTIDAAKEMCLISFTDKAKEIRKYLIGLSSKVDRGELHTDDQVVKMAQLAAIFKYVCYQDDVEKMHQAKFVSENSNSKNPYAGFHAWRNKILEIEPHIVEERIKQFCIDNSRNLIAKTKKDKILMLDKYETIRNAVWDFLQLKGEINAMKIADLVKRVAEAQGMQLHRNNEGDLFKVKESLPQIEYLNASN